VRREILVLLALLSFSCTKDPISTDPVVDTRIPLTYTSQDSAEARDLALWASTKIVPSDSLFNEMLYSINLLRYTFKDSSTLQRAIGNRFMLPWVPTHLAIKFDSATAVLVRNGTYSGWSQLPPEAKFDSIEPPDVLGWSLIMYSQRRNPWQLRKYYAGLPGVIICEPDGIIFAMGDLPIRTLIINGQMHYIFEEDPLSGFGGLHYFYYQDDKPIYGGIFYNNPDPKPFWWEDAKKTYDGFSLWGKN
jgi:hypothetical protein